MKTLMYSTKGWIWRPGQFFLNHVFLPGEPDPPRKLEVTEMTKNSAVLAWLPPLRDGGAKIDGYIVSYREEEQPADRWTEYSVVKDLSLVVTGLKEGKKYKFRVAARNAVGVSLPREAEGVYEAKEQLCKWTLSHFYHVITVYKNFLLTWKHLSPKNLIPEIPEI